jgi:hypothetical protein
MIDDVSDLLAQASVQAEAETDEHFAKLRAMHDAALAKYKGSRLVTELRMALSTERLQVLALRGRVDSLVKENKLLEERIHLEETTISLLVERCKQAGVELPASMEETPRTRH